MNLGKLRIRLEAVEAKTPKGERRPRLVTIMSTDAPAVRGRLLAEAEREGNPVLEIELFNSDEAS